VKQKILSQAEIKRIYKATEKEDPILVYYFYRKISFPISSKVLLHMPVTPNYVTMLSLFIGILAALFISLSRYPFLIWASILIHLIIVSDCADGEVARLKNMTSKFGEWLDHNTDVLKFLALYFGLAIGYYHQSGNVDAFVFLSLLVASRFLLNIAVVDAERIFSQQIYRIVKAPSVYKIGEILRIKPQFLTFSDDIKYLILSLGVLLNQLKFTMLLFIFIHLSLWLFAIVSVIKEKS